jgi:hypothetical protein
MYMLVPQLYRENQAWTNATSAWLQSRLTQINRDTAAANTIELVDSCQSDIRQFIRELEQKKREVNQKVLETRSAYNALHPRPPNRSGKGGVTQSSIDREKASIIEQLKNWSVALDAHITAMNRVLLDMEKRIQTQTGGRDAIKLATANPPPTTCPHCGASFKPSSPWQGEAACAYCGQTIRWFSPPIHLAAAPVMSLRQAEPKGESGMNWVSQSLKNRGCVATAILVSLALFGICLAIWTFTVFWAYAGIPIALILAFLLYKFAGIRNTAYTRLAWLRRIPGFRSANPRNMAAATLLYLLPFWLLSIILVFPTTQKQPSMSAVAIATPSLPPATHATIPTSEPTALATVASTIQEAETPSPFATIAPTKEPTPLPQPSPASQVPGVASRDVNIRGGPGVNYAVVGGLKQGDSIAVVGKSVDGDWWQIDRGWVSTGFVEVSGNTTAVPVVAAPPLPTLTATAVASATPTIQVVYPPPTIAGIRVGAVCNDGTRSNATGRGACSHHGGVAYWLYQ